MPSTYAVRSKQKTATAVPDPILEGPFSWILFLAWSKKGYVAVGAKNGLSTDVGDEDIKKWS